jgi:hypothetical protein
VKNLPINLRICLLGTFLLLTGLHQSAAQNFGIFSNPTAGSHPCSIVAIDVNKDGKLDLIIANDNINGTLTVLTNNGGGFGSNATLHVGSEPIQLISADINGDGKADLISANNGTNTLSVFTNNGSGGFGSNATYTVDGSPSSIAAADFNNDGKVDLICAKRGTNTLTVLTNNGSGRFSLSANFAILLGSGWVVTADFNGDGKPDVACANANGNTLTVMTNKGNGSFKTNGIYSVGFLGPLPFSITAADVNGDGKVDLVCASQNSATLTVLTNNGSGGFALASSPNLGATSAETIIAVDLNGDGKPDLVCPIYTGQQLLVWTNIGNGQFKLSLTNFVSSFPASVTAADVNNDGRLDLLSADYGLFETPNTLITVLTNSTIFPPPTSTPSLNINPFGNGMLVSWPSDSAGWSLQQSLDLTTAKWLPSGYNGYGVADDGTNKSLVVTPPNGNLFFRLLHP